MDEKNLQEYLAFAKTIAEKAGEIMNSYYRADQSVEIKSDATPVTVADKAINDLLIEEVKKQYPYHGVLGEEASWNETRSELWVCDPIDGTVSFIMHVPLAMFSLAFVEDGVPKVAVAYSPWTQAMYWAVLGGGSHRNGEPIAVSGRDWGQRTMLLGSSHGGSREPVDHPKIWKELYQAGVNVTKLPGTVFKGCLVAEGSADGRIFVHNGAHDIAAIKLIIEEAGGKVTDLTGSEQPYSQAINGAVMSNGLIHAKLLGLVEQYANTRD